MNNKVIDSFSYAAQQVLSLMLDMETHTEESESSGNPVDAKELVTIVIGLTGDRTGDIYFGFHKNTALEIVKTMSGMEIEEIDDFVVSAMSEISNIISGNAATVLSENKIVCDILPPIIQAECSQSIPEGGGNAVITNTTIHTTIGDIDLTAIMS